MNELRYVRKPHQDRNLDESEIISSRDSHHSYQNSFTLRLTSAGLDDLSTCNQPLDIAFAKPILEFGNF
jgi:hypothetical protein